MVKIDADHGLAETFFKIRSGTCRKIGFCGQFFYCVYVLQPGWKKIEIFNAGYRMPSSVS